MIYTLSFKDRNSHSGLEINTTSSSKDTQDLSPFFLGPIPTYIPGVKSLNFENLWQFSKCYKKHLVLNWYLTEKWEKWRNKGWSDTWAHRYPMGKGAIPEFAYWGGERLSYVDSRKKIYAPIYAKYVKKTETFKHLKEIHKSGRTIVLRDFDAYDDDDLIKVINNPDKKMGHAFVIKMLLTGKLKECVNSETPPELKLKDLKASH